ncbi:hypothetical protein M3M35_05765 [Fructilactobacillus myrtifloralis]|uniref:Integral membrane protein n=1 Tax=Fructilactobacillus myrtifloralis TaxID=2940301 RepID=A0ABY5BMI2_9LACO|nr:hypothetical protein [Fructilactobacillus myrtifloralis]USS84812.1 hypothetical protein M3M35_05765 [Fructilactobacillus myrtifloralis]
MSQSFFLAWAWQTGKLAGFLSIILIGWPLLVGWLTAHFARRVQRTLVTTFSERAQYWVGGLGVIIHELGHLLFALVFLHHISSFKLLNLSGNRDGSLGSVASSYNPRNWYQAVGNFFIGLAPMFSGIFVLGWLVKVLCHPTWSPIQAPAFINQAHPVADYASFAWQTCLTWLSETAQAFLTSASWQQVLLILLIGMISTTTFSLSSADLKSSLQGAKTYLVLVVVFSIVIMGIAIVKPQLTYQLDQFVLISAAVWLVLLILISLCLVISWLEITLVALLLKLLHLK